NADGADDGVGHPVLQDAALRCIALLALDRFGDYARPLTVAPVRAAAAGALTSIVSQLPPDGVAFVLQSLLRFSRHEDEQVRLGSMLGLRAVIPHASRVCLLPAPTHAAAATAS